MRKEGKKEGGREEERKEGRKEGREEGRKEGGDNTISLVFVEIPLMYVCMYVKYSSSSGSYWFRLRWKGVMVP